MGHIFKYILKFIFYNTLQQLLCSPFYYSFSKIHLYLAHNKHSVKISFYYYFLRIEQTNIKIELEVERYSTSNRGREVEGRKKREIRKAQSNTLIT